MWDRELWGWGLVVDIAAMFAAMDMSNMHAYLAQINNSYITRCL